MDRGAYEKISITESVGPLKTYGSTSRHISRQENYIKHFLSSTDTLQGIALKYNVTIEQIRRINKLWASDSLFLREHLLIPTSDPTILNQVTNSEVTSPTTSFSEVSSPTSISSFECDNINEFLNKIDQAIAITKDDIKKTRRNSRFQNKDDLDLGQEQADSSGRKTIVNNNSSNDSYQNAHSVALQHGKRVKTSLKQHEKQQEELFEL